MVILRDLSRFAFVGGRLSDFAKGIFATPLRIIHLRENADVSARLLRTLPYSLRRILRVALR